MKKSPFKRLIKLLLRQQLVVVLLAEFACVESFLERPLTTHFRNSNISTKRRFNFAIDGWVQDQDGEWEWEEDDPNYQASTSVVIQASATPQLPSGTYRPKQSLGQNYLKDPNTVAKIVRAFHQDASRYQPTVEEIVELGPGAGALTDKLVEVYGASRLHCIEIDERSIQLLEQKHPTLKITHADVLQVDYSDMAIERPLVVIGNLPYYITSQILFALADAAHVGAVSSATVTMQWEVGQRMVAKPKTKDYGILSVVFQLYADVVCHFKIPPTVFYPKPAVDSALIGLHFYSPSLLRERLQGVAPVQLRRVVTTAFQQRRKTLRNSLKKLCQQEGVELSEEWAVQRPEELTPEDFVALTKSIFGTQSEMQLGKKVWRKLKHGSNN
ncbi:dimethyladenosine transferase 1, mitochondrial [Fistulifera solaris]|jgi:ribosomal RNA small subunit methyltransferase A|uniref:rRNA adenine N(6)-methyltransferase n=1 Tax=Fistulifera solaris TaxID=1519565 RepID=A0A1Z5JI80_FISSO|nr:dimethyladenosine transferase 1, mitochondrial [Fistulifera solaris]|eukprot:GAX13720.1 dimethyladenosine transferase 1, mitochondrial [Fistulifera solaris]